MKGYNLPVVTNINLINPIGTLDDGRPIFSTAVNASTRVDPRYNVINSVQSLGESTYKNLTLQLTRRQYKGIGFDFAYTLGKSEDNAPITGTLSVQGDAGRSDMTNLDRDLGPNILDQRHTFVGSIVATPQFERGGAAGAILNNNVFGVAIQLASGIPVNLRSNLELNNDGTASDRPIGVRAQLADAAGAQERRLPLLAQVPHPGQHGGGSDRGGEEHLQHRAGLGRRPRRWRPTRSGVPTGAAADVGRSARADRRLRAAAVPVGVQVHLLRRLTISDTVGSRSQNDRIGMRVIPNRRSLIVYVVFVWSRFNMRRRPLRPSPSSSPRASAHSTAQHQLHAGCRS